jgi:hypothetical protein
LSVAHGLAFKTHRAASDAAVAGGSGYSTADPTLPLSRVRRRWRHRGVDAIHQNLARHWSR